MNERERNTLSKILELVEKLDNENQNYIIGMMDGMAIEKEKQQSRQFQEA